MLKLYIIFLKYLNDLKYKNSKLEIYKSHRGLQLSYEKYLHLTPYKNDMIFPKRQRLYAINIQLKLCLIFLSILTTSNEKPQNEKVVDLVESYNFHIKIIFIQDRMKKIQFF